MVVAEIGTQAQAMGSDRMEYSLHVFGMDTDMSVDECPGSAGEHKIARASW